MNNKFFYLIFFAIILALSRIIPHPPNFSPILASAIMSPIIIKDRWYGSAIPIVAMFISDIIIGFHPYQFVIYSTLLTISLVSPIIQKNIMIGAMALFGSIWFFLTTNFAVWAIWDYYPKTTEGLITCYTLALPFFKNTLISTCLFTFILTISLKYLDVLYEKTNYWIFHFSKSS